MLSFKQYLESLKLVMVFWYLFIFVQFDLIVLFISIPQKLILLHVNAIQSDVFSFSLKNLVISH